MGVMRRIKSALINGSLHVLARHWQWNSTNILNYYNIWCRLWSPEFVLGRLSTGKFAMENRRFLRVAFFEMQFFVGAGSEAMTLWWSVMDFVCSALSMPCANLCFEFNMFELYVNFFWTDFCIQIWFIIIKYTLRNNVFLISTNVFFFNHSNWLR